MPAINFGPLTCRLPTLTAARLVSYTSSFQSDWREIDPQGIVAESEVLNVSFGGLGEYSSQGGQSGCFLLNDSAQMSGSTTIGGYRPAQTGTFPATRTINVSAATAVCANASPSLSVFAASITSSRAMRPSYRILADGTTENASTNIPNVGLPNGGISWSSEQCAYTVTMTATVNSNRLIPGNVRIIAIASASVVAVFQTGRCAGAANATGNCAGCGGGTQGGGTF